MQCIPAEDRFTYALQVVLDYLWDAEAADYGSRSPQEKQGHIFAHLETLHAWLSTPKKTLDKSYHTVAPQCLPLMRVESEDETTSVVTTFTRTYCAFAVESRLVGRPVSNATYAANRRGVA